MNERLVQKLLFLKIYNDHFGEKKDNNTISINNNIKFNASFTTKTVGYENYETGPYSVKEDAVDINLYIYNIDVLEAEMDIKDNRIKSMFKDNITDKYSLANTLIQLYSDTFFAKKYLSNSLPTEIKQNFEIPAKAIKDIEKEFIMKKEDLFEFIEAYDKEVATKTKQKQLKIDQYK